MIIIYTNSLAIILCVNIIFINTYFTGDVSELSEEESIHGIWCNTGR